MSKTRITIIRGNCEVCTRLTVVRMSSLTAATRTLGGHLANTHTHTYAHTTRTQARTHTRTHARTHTHTFPDSLDKHHASGLNIKQITDVLIIMSGREIEDKLTETSHQLNFKCQFIEDITTKMFPKQKLIVIVKIEFYQEARHDRLSFRHLVEQIIFFTKNAQNGFDNLLQPKMCNIQVFVI